MKRLFFVVLWGILTAIIVFPLSAQNIVPNPPHQLSAKFKELSDGTFDVQLSWYFPINSNGVFPDGFKIYKTLFQNGIVTTFLEAEVPAQIGMSQYSFVVHNLQPGTYEFYATSYLGKAESKPSNTVRLVLAKQEPFIKIVSQPPIYAYVGKKYIYNVKVYTNINCPVDIFEFEGTPPQGMTISKEGVVEWIPQQTGEYTVTIKVGTSCKINVQPTFQTFKIIVLPDQPNEKPYVRIVSQPPTYGVIGTPISYQVVAESNIRCPIKYKLYDGNMEGAHIDQETGLFTWTPTKAGQYSIIIIAYLSCDTTILTYQKVLIVVQETNPHQKNCAHVVGTAKFEDDTPVPNGITTAWKLDDNNNQTNIVFKTYIKNGVFEFYLPAGTYVFEFNGEMFEHIFFANATRFMDATRIKLDCNDTTPTEFPLEVILKKKPEPVVYEVSGHVLSSKDSTPVPAYVEFIPVEFLFNPDRKQNYGAVPNFVTKTDQKGNYKISLPNTFTYIAHAIPITPNHQFNDQYYYLSNSPYLADIIELDGDRSDINFLLDPVEKIENGFSGIVIDKDRNPIQSRVMAIMVSPHLNVPPQKTPYSRIVETNENGLFTFTNLVPGDYVLLSIPKDKQFAPGYYKMNDFATLKWKEATKISVDQSMIQMIFEIKHRNRSGWKGLVRFEGQVADATRNVKVDNEPQCDVYVSEALVYAVDGNGDIIDYCVTDINGKFVLESLPANTFKLSVSKVGYQDYEMVVNADYEANYYINKTLYIFQEVSEVPEDSKFTLKQTQQNLLLSFENSFVPQKVEIVDIFGNEFPATYIQGENTIIIDISKLTSGVYFLRLSDGREMLSEKFVIVR